MSKKKQTLSDDQMVTERPMGRRSSMAMLGAGVLGAVGLVGAVAPSEAEAQCTDSDSGYGADPAGRGRRCCRGISDSDPSDPVGCGRRACSDSDPHDPGGQGRHC
jgi:hypothetical protein